MMRNIKDCYKKDMSGQFYNKGDFYVDEDCFINTIDCGNTELSFDKSAGEIYLEVRTGQNYRRIKPHKGAKQQS